MREEKNIFPYQEEAGIIIHPCLQESYLKAFAEKVLQAIGPETEEYYEAQRLLSYYSPLEIMIFPVTP